MKTNRGKPTSFDKLSKNITSGIGAIKQMRPFVSQSVLYIILYNALIQPHFDYCNLVWANCGKSLSDRLHKLQNRAARMSTFSSYDALRLQLVPLNGARTIILDTEKKVLSYLIYLMPITY